MIFIDHRTSLLGGTYVMISSVQHRCPQDAMLSICDTFHY